jgi:glyoxylate reductase
MSEQRIIITRTLPGDPLGILREAGFDNVWMNREDRNLTRAELLDIVRGAHAVIPFPADAGIDAELFDAAGETLRIVSTYAVGVDNIDLAEAARRGVIVGYTPGAVTEPTADIAWLLMLGAARRAYEGERLMRSGKWMSIAPTLLLGHRLVRRTLLIIGAGRIGSAVARRSIGWEMTVLYTDTARQEAVEAEPINAKRVPLEEGLARADFVSLHTPLTDDTLHLINAQRLGLMKETAILINTSRGSVVDEAALVEALKAGRIAAAGLDVYEHEPKLHPGLAELDNVFLLPHIGSATIDDREWMMEIAVNNVIAALRGERPPHVIA